MNIDSIIAPYGRTVVRLLKGPVEVTDTNAWAVSYTHLTLPTIA